MFRFLILCVCAVPLFLSCQKKTGPVEAKLAVSATLFPQYDFARRIAGSHARVTLILPPGVEAHSYEPAPRDLARIMKSRVFLFTGRMMEPWSEKLTTQLQTGGTFVVDVGEGITLASGDEHHEEEEADGHGDHNGHDGHGHAGADPHFWTDPLLARQIVSNIARALVAADPAHQQDYQANAALLDTELLVLHRDFDSALKPHRGDRLIFAGHFALGYLARRYGLEFESPYAGFSPDAEPTAQRLAGLVKTMKQHSIRTIFYEELIDPKVARLIAGETGASLVMLHAAHNVSRDELKSGVTYLSLMRGNLEKLEKGLGNQD